MAVDRIDFNSSENTSADEIGGALPLAINCLVDKGGTVVQRPSVSRYAMVPDGVADGYPVIGMTEYNGNLVWVTSDRRIRAISPEGTFNELSTSDPNTQLDGGLRPSFVRGRNMLVIAGGGALQKWTGAGPTQRFAVLDPTQPPPLANMVSGIAQTLVVAVPNRTGQIWWSDVEENYEVWDFTTSLSSFTQAAAKPDSILALYDNTNEVFAFGEETIQVFAPTGLEVSSNNIQLFTPLRCANLGVIGRDAIIPVDDAFYIIDSNKRVLLTDARSYEDKGQAIVKTLRGMTKIDDAWGFRLRFGRHDSIVFMFPSEGRGLSMEIESGRWSEWRMWDKGAIPIDINAAYYWTQQGKLMVGLADGGIGFLTDDGFGDSGRPIQTKVVSGFSSRGSNAQKWCKAVSMVFRRGSLGVPTGNVKLSSRDDLGEWHLRREFSLGASPSLTVITRSLGTYRQRQWMIEYTGVGPFALASVQEDFEILGV